MVKLTRKAAIDKAVARGTERSESFTSCAQWGVDYGIVLGLQMAAKIAHGYFSGIRASEDLEEQAAARLKRLEKKTNG